MPTSFAWCHLISFWQKPQGVCLCLLLHFEAAIVGFDWALYCFTCNERWVLSESVGDEYTLWKIYKPESLTYCGDITNKSTSSQKMNALSAFLTNEHFYRKILVVFYGYKFDQLKAKRRSTWCVYVIKTTSCFSRPLNEANNVKWKAPFALWFRTSVTIKTEEKLGFKKFKTTLSWLITTVKIGLTRK